MNTFISATINDKGELDLEFNCNSKKEAFIIAATIAAELIKNRNDYNTFCKIVKKVIKNDEKR